MWKIKWKLFPKFSVKQARVIQIKFGISSFFAKNNLNFKDDLISDK